jgi:hypothetical protein
VRIPIVNISKILKKKVLGLFNSSLEVRVGRETYNFTSFQQRDMAYERIMAVWRVSSPHAIGEGKSVKQVYKRANTLSSHTSSEDEEDILAMER